GVAVDGDGPADRARVAAEVALPEPVADDGDGRVAGELLVGPEAATDDRAHAERVEEVGRGHGHVNAPRLARARDDVAVADEVGREVLERRLLLAPVEEVRGRDLRAV